MNILEFIRDYWFVIIAFIGVVSFVSIKIYNWFKQPSSKQKEQIKQWLIFAVAKAEAELGTGTGQLKLSKVYDMFIEKFPAIALFVSFEDFSVMVDEALNKLEEIMKDNQNIQDVIESNRLEG